MQRPQFLVGAVEPLEFDQRQRNVEPGAAKLRRLRRHGARHGERLLVQILLEVHIPQRHQHTAVMRRPRHRALEEPLLRHRRRGHQPLM